MAIGPRFGSTQTRSNPGAAPMIVTPIRCRKGGTRGRAADGEGIPGAARNPPREADRLLTFLGLGRQGKIDSSRIARRIRSSDAMATANLPPPMEAADLGEILYEVVDGVVVEKPMGAYEFDL